MHAERCMPMARHTAHKLRIWVVTICVLMGAALPFLIPGAAAARFFTDAEARLGYGAFSMVVHALIGALFGAGLAEFIVWLGGSARGAPNGRAQTEKTDPEPNGDRHS